MKKAIFILVVFLTVLSNEIVSQEGWFWQNPLPQGNRLLDVGHLADLAVAVGDNGAILTNDGSEWQVREGGTTTSLYSVSMIGNNIWTVGLDGTILHSSDGSGANWDLQISGVDEQLRSVFFLNDNLGWCVGLTETVLRTTNGGSDWEILRIDGTQHYMSVLFFDENNGWLAGASGSKGVIKYSNDGGKTWRNSIIPANRMNSICFADTIFGCAVGDGGAIFRTTDGGENWELANSNTSQDLEDVVLDTSGKGWAVGYDGTIITTTDWGANWNSQISCTQNHLNATSGKWVVGEAGTILRTSDGGANWECESSGYYNGLIGLDFLDENNGWVVGGEGTILHTTDGGMTWDSIPNGATKGLYTVEFINADTGWVAGRDHDDSTPSANMLIQRTTDGGLTWEFQHLPGGGQMSVMDMDFIEGAPGEPMTGFCTGGLSHTWRTDDYGETWEALRGGCGEGNFNSCCFVDENTGWFVGTPSNVGTGYSIMRTIDGGETFEEQTNPTDIKLNGVCFVDNQKGLAVGNNGTIIYTSDGGENWEASPDGGVSTWQSVSLTETGKAWAVDTRGSIASSSDWGHTWEAQESGTSNTLMEVLFIDDSEGWVVGFDGIILHTTNGGVITGVSVENTNVISEFRLEQNYPNPFNPSTKIKYSIPAVGNENIRSVQLKIYDILGREIATLVNKQQKPGYYEVEWNADNHTSGVYFYRIRAGEFISAKKMILLR